MAIINIKEKTNLKLELDGGIVDEKQKTISKTFSKIKTDALDEELYETAVALGSLQKKDILNVKRIEEMQLMSQ